MRKLFMIILIIGLFPALTEAEEGYRLRYTIKEFRNKSLTRSLNMRAWLTKDKSKLEFDNVVKLYRYDLKRYFVSEETKTSYYEMVPPVEGYERDDYKLKKKTKEIVKTRAFKATIYKIEKTMGAFKVERIYHIAESTVDLKNFYQWVKNDPGLADIFGPFSHLDGLVVRVETTLLGTEILFVHEYQRLEKVEIADTLFAVPEKIIDMEECRELPDGCP